MKENLAYKHRDNSIAYIRIIAMAMIVLCHFFQYYDNELAWWFNVGVQIFFIVSGFLYGNKDIEDPIDFIVKQFKKILIPYYVFMIPAMMLYFIFAPSYISAASAIKAFLCVETIPGLEHLWFVPYILFCYLLTPYLYWLRKKIEGLSFFKTVAVCCFVLALVMVLGLLFKSFFIPDRTACYIVGFFIAVFYKKYGWNFVKKFSFLAIPIGFLINALRIYLKYLTDFKNGSFGVVFDYYERAAHMLLGLSLFLGMYIVFKKVNANRLVNKIGEYSYSVYIVHQLFILSPFALMAITGVRLVNWIIVVVTISVVAIAHKFISDKANNVLKGR